MIPLSCANCWYNALQHDSLGLPVGYCVFHQQVLNRSEATTCGHHRRKDLPVDSAEREHDLHRRAFADEIVVLRTRLPANGQVSSSRRDLELLKRDDVAEAVTDYGELGAKIEALSQLRRIPGVRAELAMLSLGRAYVRECVSLRKSWARGIHLLWWTKSRLADEPDVKVTDLRHADTLPLSRKVELARWSVIMLRLTFVSDIAYYAAGEEHALGELRDVLDEAAESVGTFNTRRLLAWVKRVALKKLERALSREDYHQVATSIHRLKPQGAS